MKIFSPATAKKFSRSLRHPLLITLLSGLLASWVIPGVVGRSNIRAARAKARIDQALEVMNTSNSVNTHSHKMQTAFQAFEKDSLKASPEDYQKRREELRGRIYSIYGDFDGIAWSWPGSIFYRGRVLQLISQNEYEELQSLGKKYTENLLAACRELDKAWRAYLPADASMPKPTTSGIMTGIEKPLQDLLSQREDVVRRMAEIFQ